MAAIDAIDVHDVTKIIIYYHNILFYNDLHVFIVGVVIAPPPDCTRHIFQMSVLAILDTEGAWLCRLHLDGLVMLVFLVSA